MSRFPWSLSETGKFRRNFRLHVVFLTAMAVLLVNGCHQQELLRQARQDPNSFLIVDCKLPPQVRNVGLAMTYIAPPQAIKTSALDCGMRGGEYVAYNQANYTTALSVWLPAAEAGTPEAQANVGEIYEKGRGTAPNYAEALRWYQKAAAAGNSRAQLSLGYLYERGLGVPKDPVAALNWYRKAAGLNEELALASSFKAGDAELRQQVSQARAEAGALRDELAQSRQEIETLRQRLGDSRSELEHNQDKLQGTLKELERSRSAAEKLKQAPPEQKQDLSRLEREIQSREAQAMREREAVSQLESRYRRENEALLAKLKSAEQRATSLNSRLDQNRFETARLQTQLAQTESTLTQLKLDYRAQQSVAAPAAGKDEKLKVLEGQLDQRERELQAQRARAKALEDEVTRLGREKQAAEQKASGQSTARDQNLVALEAQLAATQDRQRRESERFADLERQNAKLAAERDRLQAENQSLSKAPPQPDTTARVLEQQKKLAALEAQLAQREQELQSQRLRVGELQGEASRLGQEKTALEQKLGGQAATRDQSLEAISRQLTETTTKHQDERRKITELEEQNARLLAEKQQLLTTQSGTATQHNAELDKLSRQIAEYEKERSQLQKALKSAQAKSPSQPEAAAGTSEAPKIVLQDPSVPTTRDSGTPAVNLREAVAARKLTGRVLAPAGVQSLTVNDRSESINAAGVFTTEVRLTGKDTPVNITLIDKQGRKESLDFRLVLPGAPTGTASADTAAPPPGVNFGSYHALVIGNSKYSHLPELPAPVNDAAAVAGVLRQKYGFTVTQLSNATRYDILSALNKLRDTLKESDNLLIYYAGHGELDKVNQQGQWLPVDAEQNNTANWIPTDAITALLNQIAAKHILVVADSCYSGAMTRTALANLQTGVSRELRAKWVKKMLENKSRTVLTSGGLAPVLEAGAGNHSIFAQIFIDALEKNKDVVQGQELFRMIADRVKQAAERFRFEQVPMYAPIRFTDHEASDFFFVPTARG